MALIKRGVIKAYDAESHHASVQVAGSLSVWLRELPVSVAIPPSEVVPGRECAVLLFTDDNPRDAAVIAVHHAVPGPIGGGVSEFLDLDDVDPDAFTGAAERLVGVDPTETFLDFLTTFRAATIKDTAGDPRLTLGADGVRVDDRLAIAADPRAPTGDTARLDLNAPTTPASGFRSSWLEALGTAINAHSGGAIHGMHFEPTVQVNAPAAVRGVLFRPSILGSAGLGEAQAIKAGIQGFGSGLITALTVFEAETVDMWTGSVGNFRSYWARGLSGTVLGAHYGLEVEPIASGAQRRPIWIGGVGTGAASTADNSGSRIDGNLALFTLGVSGLFGGGRRVLHVAPADVVPSSSPSAGLVLWTEPYTGTRAVLKARDSAGAIHRLTPVGITLSLSNGDNHDIDIGEGTYVRVTGPTAGFAITGIAGAHAGRIVIIHNSTAQNMTIKHLDSGSSVGLRIRSNTGADQATTGIGTVMLVYDGPGAVWQIVSFAP